VNIIISTFGFIFCFLESPKIRRVGIMFSALASFCLVTISVFVIEGVPISTIPVLKYGANFKGYYGSAWYSLTAASGPTFELFFLFKYISSARCNKLARKLDLYIFDKSRKSRKHKRQTFQIVFSKNLIFYFTNVNKFCEDITHNCFSPFLAVSRS
jgi:hypothetical protein